MFGRLIVLVFLILTINFTSGCSWLAVNLTPMLVIDSVARGGAVARQAEQTAPTGEDLKAYLEANRKLWEELEKWFQLKE